MAQIYEYRGVEGLVYAPVTADTAESFTTGEVKDLAGVAEISKATESTNEPHHYDNIPAIVVCSTGSDEITINTSAIPLDVLADITGQYYDAATGMYVEKERTPKYFALGYKTKNTNGDEYFVWRLKGSFNIPDQDNQTEDDGTDANGQELTYTGISTTHKFTKTGSPVKGVTVDHSVNTGMTESTFFANVQTPDSVGGTVAVTGVGVSPSSETIEEGEELQLIATVYPINATERGVTWSSSAQGVATVDANGVVSALAEGSATITCTTVDGGKTDTCSLTVTAAS